MIESYLLLILIFMFFDNALTHYQFFICKKKGVFNNKQEMNIIARYIMGGNPRPLTFIFLFIYQILIVFLVLWIDNFSDIGIGFLCGIFVLVNVYHYGNINTYKKNWDNNSYWERAKNVIR